MAGILDDLKSNFRMGSPETRLIFINVGFFILSLPLFYTFRGGFFDFPDWIALSSDFTVSLTRPWTFLTYAFFHGGPLHLLFNMMVLHFSGSLFRTFFSAKQLIGVYLMSAIFAGIVYNAAFFLMGGRSIMVGASAAIMALLVAAATYSPNMMLRLMLFGYVKLWVLTAIILGIDILYLFVENTGGHISHLAGAFFGFAFVKLLQQGIDLSRPVTWVFDFIANGFRVERKPKFKKVHRNENPARTSAPKQQKDKTQQQIDEILDKISRSGYDSLSKEEKDFLFRSGE